ncbi:MAG: hypothetical protein M5U13_14085 [Thermoanaerobaculia bacterium]|nr:hypothetical protein [Thermoanaerobaculia bacterium]
MASQRQGAGRAPEEGARAAPGGGVARRRPPPARAGRARRGAQHRRQGVGEVAPALRVLGLGQQLDGAGAQRLEGGAHLGAVGAGGEDHGGDRGAAGERREHPEAVELRHREVEQEHVGAQAQHPFDRRLAVGRFADHPQLRIARQEAAQHRAHRGGVVDDEDREHGA